MGEYLNKLRNVCKYMRFGIEFELCQHIMGKSYDYSQHGDDVDKIEEIYGDEEAYQFGLIYQCFSTKSKDQSNPSLQWIVHHGGGSFSTYDKWQITFDESVYCPFTYEVDIRDTDDYYYHNFRGYHNDELESFNNTDCIGKHIKQEGDYKEKCVKNLPFYPVEIVSPILHMDNSKYICGEGFYLLTLTWFGWILTDNMVYLTNSSQGLHVNMSIPNMNNIHIRKFVKLWYTFEPILIRFVPWRRRDIEFGKPLRKMATPEQVETKLSEYIYFPTKHSAVNVVSGRIEIRMHQGSADYFEIYNWTLLCLFLFGASLILPEFDVREYVYDTDTDKLENLKTMFDLIQDTKLLRYFLHIYEENRIKDEMSGLDIEEWPEIYYEPDEEVIVFPRAWDILTEEDEKFIADKASQLC